MAYETMYIIRPDLGDDQIDQIIGKYETFLKEQGATDIEITLRGRRRLAYEINDHREGVYVQMNYSAQGTVIAAMERAMRLSEDVIRYLTVKPEEVVEEAIAAE